MYGPIVRVVFSAGISGLLRNSEYVTKTVTLQVIK
jgi:hypothetical protein